MLDQQSIQFKKQKATRFMEKGKLRDAAQLLHKVLKSLPKDPEALYLNGCVQARLQQWREAIQSFQSSLNVMPDVPQTHVALGGAYIYSGHYDKAISSLEQAIKLNDKMADAHSALGDIAVIQGRITDAKSAYDKAIAINSGYAPAYAGLAGLEKDQGHYLIALEYINKAISLESDNARALCIKATICSNLAEKEEAMALYEKAIRIDRNNIDAAAGLAMMHNFNGDYEKAYKIVNPLIKKNVYHGMLAIAYAECCKVENKCMEAIDYINAILEKNGLTDHAKKGLHFAAAKIFDKQKIYDEAFKHYKAANDMVRTLYDSVTHADKTTRLIEKFSTGFFMQMPKAENHDERPIFIVGMPRSGTSLTEQILAAHSKVYAAGELKDLSAIINFNILGSSAAESFLKDLDTLTIQQINAMAQTYLDKLSNLSGTALRVTDKMPQNYFLLGYIQLFFPGARIIHCRRDPMDTCLSIYFQNFIEQHQYAKSLFDIGTHYYQYERLMNHWREVLTLPYMELSYEDLVNDQENMTRKLLEFAGLEWEESCLQFHKVDRTVDTASFDQVRQPLYTKSMARWKNYEIYLDELKEGLSRPY